MLYQSEYYGVQTLGSELTHHGVKGQKWGVRRYQNPDGTRINARQKVSTENKKDSLNSIRQKTKKTVDSAKKRTKKFVSNKKVRFAAKVTAGILLAVGERMLINAAAERFAKKVLDKQLSSIPRDDPFKDYNVNIIRKSDLTNLTMSDLEKLDLY